MLGCKGCPLGANRQVAVRSAIIDWLLEADPAVRWQVHRDLIGASADDVAAERAGQPSRWLALRCLRVLRWESAR